MAQASSLSTIDRLQARPTSYRRTPDEAWAVGRNQWKAAHFGERHELVIEPFLIGIEMALKVKVQIAAAENRP
jgi:hypothetical protein